MRVIKEFSIKDIRISVFSWNNKYLLKYEQGMVEQTYKINETDIIGEADLSGFFTEAFLEQVQKTFDEMHQVLRNQLNNL